MFLALTEGDNRNVMAAQLAAEALAIPQIVAKINDPVRAEAYADLGIATICRTDLIEACAAEPPRPGRRPCPASPARRSRHPHHDSPPAAVAGTAVGTAPAGEA